MIKTYARRICHGVAVLAFIACLLLAGGIENGMPLSEARPITIAVIIITVAATFAGDLIGGPEA